MSRSHLICLAIIGHILIAALSPSTRAADVPAQAAANGGRPNILFIMTDDHAAHAISALRQRGQPDAEHGPARAAKGCGSTAVSSTNSICTPSRATILTGKY